MGIDEDKQSQGEHKTEKHNTRQDTGLTILSQNKITDIF